MSMKAMKRMGKLRLYIIYIIVAAFFLFPILWTLSMSLKSVQELYEVPPSLLPDRPMFENYEHVLIQSQFLPGLLAIPCSSPSLPSWARCSSPSPRPIAFPGCGSGGARPFSLSSSCSK